MKQGYEPLVMRKFALEVERCCFDAFCKGNVRFHNCAERPGADARTPFGSPATYSLMDGKACFWLGVVSKACVSRSSRLAFKRVMLYTARELPRPERFIQAIYSPQCSLLFSPYRP